MKKKPLLSIYSWFGYVMPLPARLKMIKENGFQAVTLWWEDEKGFKKESMPEIVRKNGLTLENIHLPYQGCNRLWSEKREERTALMENYLSSLEDCASFEIPLMIIHATEGDLLPEETGYGLEAMGQLVERAEELEVGIALENTRLVEPLLLLLDSLQSPQLGLCYDSSHARLTVGELELLEDYSHRLMATHLSDNDGLKDRHWLPGEGEICWPRLINQLTESEPDFLTLEAFPGKHQFPDNPEGFLSLAYERGAYLQELILESGRI